ncbi:MAG: hypothetical protein OK449_10460 [Thaumarchaeota archaeon]|nr:hypothetical protein [Nitrososphaerota archaeon]
MSGTVSIEGENLVLELHGVDTILAFKRSITIPVKHVLSVSTDKVDWVSFHQIRVVGTSIPGVVRDGHYLTSDGAMFSEMHDPDKCITIMLNDETYKKIIFQVEDKESAAMMISAAIAKTR